MEQLDAEAESLVAALMRGRSLMLLTDGQILLARWCLKVAMTAEYLHPAETRRIPDGHRQLLRGGGLPSDTVIFLASYQGRFLGWHQLRPITVEDKREPGLVDEGYTITLTLGRLCFQVVGVSFARHGVPEIPAEGKGWVVQLHPRVKPVMSLPPPRALNDAELLNFAEFVR
jgi:hypothetical protein